MEAGPALFGAAEFVDHFLENGPSMLFRQNFFNDLNQFGMEGYLSLLVGQKVPYRKKYAPPPGEAALWNEIRGYLNTQGQNGYTIKESLDAVRSGRWTWGVEFFKQNPFTS
jgi:tryptophan 7-halogenase